MPPVSGSHYRLLWLRRLDSLWQDRPDPTSFFGANSIVEETCATGGFDRRLANDALADLIGEGLLRAVEVGDGELAVQITAAGRSHLAELEGPGH